MSTTSLSSCDNGDCYPCSYVYDDGYERYLQSYQGPFYNTMGQPLVYYAEVQPYSRRPKGRRKENRNCFARAFDWYTQEREPDCPRRTCPELSGFATWLDAKYGEYLRDSECNPSCCPSQPPPRSTNDTGPCAPCAPCNSNETHTNNKRFSRMRSPWRKFRCQNKNGGDVPCKTPNGSCQFILQPKDLTRPASECYQTPTTCPNKSNTTVISTDFEGTKKTIIKSQSMTNVCHEKTSKNFTDVITTPCPKKIQEDTQKCKVMDNAPQVPPGVPMPCDQSCKTKQEVNGEAKIKRMSAKIENVEMPCNPHCLQEQSRSIVTPARSQNQVTRCDTHFSKLECKFMGDIQQPVKVQNQPPCEPNCLNQERKHLGEIRLPAKIQNIEISYDPNCSKQDCKPMAEIRLSARSQTMQRPYDSNYYNQDSKPVGEIHVPIQLQKIEVPYDCSRKQCKAVGETQLSFTKSQIRDIPCDSTCINKQKHTGAGATRDTMEARNITDSCDPNCYKPTYQPDTQLKGSQTKSLMKDIPCDTSCIYKQGYKPEGHNRQSAKPQNESCDPNCSGQGYKPASELPCDTNCIYVQANKLVADLERIPVRNTANSCDPNCMYKSEISTATEMRVTSVSQNTKQPCEPTCYPQQKKLTAIPCDPTYSPKPLYEIQRGPTKSQNTETTCMCYPIKSSSEVKKVPSKPQKVDHECQCPEDDTLPMIDQCECFQQTFATTSTNNNLCKCILEKQHNIPMQPPPSKPIPPCPKPTPKRSVPISNSKISQKQSNATEVSCQCPEEDIKLNTICQSDRYHLDSRCDCVCACPKPEKPRPTCNVQRPDSRSSLNYSSVSVRQVTRCLTFRNDAAQTSDHSICLEDVSHDYSFFMRIVCADKLNDCFCDTKR